MTGWRGRPYGPVPTWWAANGGDGTITACVGGVAGSGVPLTVLPYGSGDLLAPSVGLPPSPGEALTGSERLAAEVLLRRRTGQVARPTCRALAVDASRARP